MNWEHIVANFVVGFCTAFGAISMVDGLPQERLLYAGLIGGVIQGLLAAGRDMLEQSDSKKGIIGIYGLVF